MKYTYMTKCEKRVSKTTGKEFYVVNTYIYDVENSKIIESLCSYFPKFTQVECLKVWGLVENENQE